MQRPVQPPMINPAAEDEQGRGLSRPRGGGGGPASLQKTESPLAIPVIGQSGSGGSSSHMNSPMQFPKMPGMPGEGAGAAEGAAGAGEAAGGAAALEELAPLVLLA